MNSLFALLIAVGCLGGCIYSQRKDALRKDPWYIPSNPQSVRPKIVDYAKLVHDTPYLLAKGQGTLQKAEFIAEPIFTTRLTYTLDQERWYRIVQSQVSGESYTPKTSVKQIYRGRVMWIEDAMVEFGAAIWWDDKTLGYVEISSDELSGKELYALAQGVIDSAVADKK